MHGLTGVDANGFILPAPNGPIQNEFRGLIPDACGTLASEAGANLDGIYVYGSVAAGTAQAGRSDLDLCIVLRHEDARTRAAIESTREPLLKRHSEITKIDFDIGLRDEVLAPENYFKWGYWLKHHCRHIWGTNLATSFPPFKPSRDIAIAVNGDFSEVLEQYLVRIDKEKDLSRTRQLQKEAARKIIRSTNVLRKEHDPDWPRSLEMHVELFLQNFPAMTAQVQFFLAEAIHPSSAPLLFISHLRDFVSWMNIELEKTR